MGTPYMRSVGPAATTAAASTGGVALSTAAWGPEFGAASPSVGAHVAMPALAVVGQARAGAHVAGQLGPSYAAHVGAHPAMTGLALVGQSRAGAKLAAPSYTTSAIIAGKDVWCDTVAGCVTDTNRNSTDLQLDPVAATSKQAYWAFDLTGFPASSTVTAATLTVNVATAPVGTSSTVALFQLANADETWDETTMKCSTRKNASGGSLDSFIVATTDSGEKTVALSGFLSRIDARMGVGFVTFLAQVSSIAGSCILRSKDGGVDNAHGPRLAITFTSP